MYATGGASSLPEGPVSRQGTVTVIVTGNVSVLVETTVVVATVTCRVTTLESVTWRVTVRVSPGPVTNCLR